MRMLVLVALISGLAAFIAADRADEGQPPSWEEHTAFVQSVLAATLARIAGDAPPPAAAAPGPELALVRYPLLAGLVASGAILAYSGVLWLAVRLGAVP